MKSIRTIVAVPILALSFVILTATSRVIEAAAEPPQIEQAVPLSLLIKRPETPHGAPIGQQSPA